MGPSANQKPIAADFGQESTEQSTGRSTHRPVPIDFAFLDAQTFGDADLARELLELFAAQARRVLPTLPHLPATEQDNAAHLLKGSARGIGAWGAAHAAAAYEATLPSERGPAYADLNRAFADAIAEIETRPT